MFVFFKQKTAYEMRISDWSSDVCSSDLHVVMDGLVMPALLPRRDIERDHRTRIGLVERPPARAVIIGRGIAERHLDHPQPLVGGEGAPAVGGAAGVGLAGLERRGLRPAAHVPRPRELQTTPLTLGREHVCT